MNPEALAQWIVEVVERGGTPLIYMYGQDSLAKRRGAEAVVDSARSQGLANWRLVTVDVPAIVRSQRDWAQMIRLARREAIFNNAGVLWAGVDVLFAGEQDPWEWGQLLSAGSGLRRPVFVDRVPLYEPANLPDDVEYVRVAYDSIQRELREAEWMRVLEELGPELDEELAHREARIALAEQLAARYVLTASGVRNAAKSALASAAARQLLDVTDE